MGASRIHVGCRSIAGGRDKGRRYGTTPQVERILALQRSAGNAAVGSLLAVQREDAVAGPRPPFTAGQTVTLAPPPLTMSFAQLRAAGVAPDKLPTPAKEAHSAGKGDDEDEPLEAENEVKAKTMETTVSANIANPFAYTLPKVGIVLWPKLKPGLVFEREDNRTTKVSPQLELVMLSRSIQMLGHKLDLDAGATFQPGSPIEIGAGFQLDLFKRKIIDPNDRSGKRTVTVFEVDLDLKGSLQTTADPDTKQAESKLRGNLTIKF
ncbi:MAG: hypothetical protein NVSMB32_11250 [Actinomycetota bacterium]